MKQISSLRAYSVQSFTTQGLLRRPQRRTSHLPSRCVLQSKQKTMTDRKLVAVKKLLSGGTDVPVEATHDTNGNILTEFEIV